MMRGSMPLISRNKPTSDTNSLNADESMNERNGYSGTDTRATLSAIAQSNSR